MDQIEQQVVLPEGARLRDYERYYSFDGHGRVVGVYVGSRPRYGPDERQHWVKNIEKLPHIMDGGCGIITLLYDPAARKVQRLSCNGVA